MLKVPAVELPFRRFSLWSKTLRDLNFSQIIGIAILLPWWNEAAVNTIKFGNNLFFAARAIHDFLLFLFDPLLTLSDGFEHAIVSEVIFAGLILN